MRFNFIVIFSLILSSLLVISCKTNKKAKQDKSAQIVEGRDVSGFNHRVADTIKQIKIVDGDVAAIEERVLQLKDFSSSSNDLKDLNNNAGSLKKSFIGNKLAILEINEKKANSSSVLNRINFFVSDDKIILVQSQNGVNVEKNYFTKTGQVFKKVKFEKTRIESMAGEKNVPLKGDEGATLNAIFLKYNSLFSTLQPFKGILINQDGAYKLKYCSDGKLESLIDPNGLILKMWNLKNYDSTKENIIVTNGVWSNDGIKVSKVLAIEPKSENQKCVN